MKTITLYKSTWHGGIYEDFMSPIGKEEIENLEDVRDDDNYVTEFEVQVNDDLDFSKLTDTEKWELWANGNIIKDTYFR